MILALVAAAAFQPQPILTIDPKHRIVEGIASDGRTIWVSSIIDRQILRCRTNCEVLATLPEGLHPFAISWDSTRKRLWVAADCPPDVPGIAACERGAVIALDKRGQTVARIAPELGTFHPGDVSASKGEVFVSDSQNGMVFRLAPNGRAMMAVVLPGVGKSGQGSALSEDGKQLLVADYSQGVGAVDLATSKRTLLAKQDGRTLHGIDGLVRCGSTYYGIYNGVAPGFLVSITLTAEGLTYGKPLGDTTLPDPTQIAFDGKRLLIVADSGWATIEKAGFVRTQGAAIVAVPLGKDCKPL